MDDKVAKCNNLRHWWNASGDRKDYCFKAKVGYNQLLDVFGVWIYSFIKLHRSPFYAKFFENGIPSVLLKFTGLEKNVGFSIICLVHIYAMTQFQQEFLCL